MLAPIFVSRTRLKSARRVGAKDKIGGEFKANT